MVRFIVRRLGFVVLTLLLASVIIFAATQILPGDVARTVLGRSAGEAALEDLREQLGLNRPLIVQYLDWLWGFVQGDWGVSLSTQAGVRGLVMGRLGNSLMLALVGFAFYVPLGVFLGVIAAMRRHSWLDQVISITSLVFIGLPEFVMGVILIALFALQLEWLPASSAISPDTGFLAALPHLVLPGVAIASVGLAYVTRMTRAGTIEVLGKDYTRTAYLKGLPSGRIVRDHVLRNALLPTITVVAVGIGWLIGGLIVTESVFGYPGLGRLILYAVKHQDIPLVQASTMLMVLIFSLANLGADLLYAYLNPRIRYR